MRISHAVVSEISGPDLDSRNTADQPTRIGCDTFEVATREAVAVYLATSFSVWVYAVMTRAGSKGSPHDMDRSNW